MEVSALPSYQVLSLETLDNSLIRDIDRIYCYQDTLFAFDRFMKRIVLFRRSDGKHLHTIEHVGKGPGEYVQATDFCLDASNRQLIVASDIPHKLLFYSFTGELVKEITLPVYYKEIVTDGTQIFGLVNDAEGDRIEVLDYAGKQQYTVQIPSKQLEADSPEVKHTFAKGHQLSVYNKEVYLTTSYDNAIYTIGEDGLHKKYAIDFKESTLPENLPEKNLSAKEFSKLCRENNWVCTMLDLAQTPGKLFFRTNVGFFFCDKESGSMAHYRTLSMPGVGGSSTIQALNGTNEVVEVLSSVRFKKMLDLYKEYKKDESDIDPVLWQIYHATTEESNPILIICAI